MPKKTHLSVFSLPGRVKSFSPKEEALAETVDGRLLLDPTSGARLQLTSSSGGGVLLLGVPQMGRQLANFQISIVMQATLQNLIDDDTVTVPALVGFDAAPKALSDGTSADQADRGWRDTGRTILSGASENIDMFDVGGIDISGAGPGRDGTGLTVSIAELVGLLIKNRTTSAGDLVIGGEGSGAAFNSFFNGSDTAVLGPFGPGGICMLFNHVDPAWLVADTTNHLLKIAAVGGNITYDIAWIARSA